MASSDYDQHIVKPPSYEAIMKQLHAGFDLGWSVECRDCSLAGKSCGVDARDLNLGTKPLPYQCKQGQFTSLVYASLIFIRTYYILYLSVC